MSEGAVVRLRLQMAWAAGRERGAGRVVDLGLVMACLDTLDEALKAAGVPLPETLAAMKEGVQALSEPRSMWQRLAEVFRG